MKETGEAGIRGLEKVNKKIYLSLCKWYIDPHKVPITHRFQKLIYLHLFTELFHEDFSPIVKRLFQLHPITCADKA